MTKMKTRILLPLIALLLCATACKEENKPTQNRTCTVIYTVDKAESSTMIHSESEWGKLLDQFCDYAEEGKSVTFYNLNSQPADLYTAKSGPVLRKESNTISTSNRDEMKAWMRRMEQAGKTVNVTYDRQTGVWNGTAYAVAPVVEDSTIYQSFTGVLVSVSLSDFFSSQQIYEDILALRINADTTLVILQNNCLFSANGTLEGYSLGDTVTLSGYVSTADDNGGDATLFLNLITADNSTPIGTWQFSNYTEYTYGNGEDYLIDVYSYFPEENGRPIYYTFNADGTAARTVGNTAMEPEYGTWSISYDAITCNLTGMAGGTWNIVWLTSNTMIITRWNANEEKQQIAQQMVLTNTSNY